MSGETTLTTRQEGVCMSRSTETGEVIHFSSIEGSVFFVCRKEVEKGDLWSQYVDHVTCPSCLDWIETEGVSDV